MKKLLLTALLMCLSANFALASTPVKLSLWNEIDVPQDDTVRGIELGIGSYTPNMTGFIFDFLVNKTDDAIGVQMAMITITTNITGLQLGLINVNNQDVYGAQIGLFNNAENVKGFQFGFVNLTTDIYGVQIGFINYIKQGTFPSANFPAMIIINAKF